MDELKRSNIQIFINDNEIPVYLTAVNTNRKWQASPTVEQTPFVCFDMNEIVHLKIIFPEIVEQIKIYPQIWNITPEVNGKEVRFQISQAGNYTIEYNGIVTKPIHIFVNNEEEIPKNITHYIKPGIHKKNIIAKSNDVIYIAAGAVIEGQIVCNNEKNVTICGRGIISGNNIPSWLIDKARPQINMNHSENIKIDGLIFLNSNCWALNLYQCKNIKINNIKIITARPNGDGISLQSCVSAYISNSFVRTWDDSLVIKNYSSINSHDIYFDNIQIWTDLAQSCEIGYETNKGKAQNSEIYNIHFNNIIVLHNFHKPVLSIHNADNAWVHDIFYNDIIVEDAQMGNEDAKYNNQLIDLTINANTNWSSTKDRGKISDISIKNVKILSGNFSPSRILGYDKNHNIKNVKIINLQILDKKVLNQEDGLFDINEFCENIIFQ